jgi:hypothetical protein
VSKNNLSPEALDLISKAKSQTLKMLADKIEQDPNNLEVDFIFAERSAGLLQALAVFKEKTDSKDSEKFIQHIKNYETMYDAKRALFCEKTSSDARKSIYTVMYLDEMLDASKLGENPITDFVLVDYEAALAYAKEKILPGLN